jgi:hypothetical protein
MRVRYNQRKGVREKERVEYNDEEREREIYRESQRKRKRKDINLSLDLLGSVQMKNVMVAK